MSFLTRIQAEIKNYFDPAHRCPKWKYLLGDTDEYQDDEWIDMKRYRIHSYDLSFLSICILFQKYQIFLDVFPYLIRQERQNTPNIWLAIFENLNACFPINDHVDKFCMTQVFQKIMTIFRQGANFEWRVYGLTLHLQYAIYAAQKKVCTSAAQMSDFRYHQQFMSSFRHAIEVLPKDTIPVLTLSFVESFLNQPQPEVFFENPKTQETFLCRVWKLLFNESCHIFDQAYRLRRQAIQIVHESHVLSFRRFIARNMLDFMKRHLPRMLKPQHAAATHNLAFEISSHRCMMHEISEDSKYCKISFLLKNTPVSVILARHEYSTEHRYIYIKHGSCFTNSHPWLRTQLEKFRGVVPRLKFASHTSDGVLIPESSMKVWFPNVPFSGIHGTDVTRFLEIRRVAKHKKRAPLPKSPPFSKYFVFGQPPISLATEYVALPEADRMVLHDMLWDLHELGYHPASNIPTPKLVKFVTRLVSREMIIDPKMAHFWRRLEPFTHFSVELKAYYLLATRQEPNVFSLIVEYCTDAKLFPALARLISKEKNPISDSPQQFPLLPIYEMHANLLVLLYSRGVSAPIKRLAWQSLVFCRYQPTGDRLSSIARDYLFTQGTQGSLDSVNVTIPFFVADTKDAIPILYHRKTGTIDDIEMAYDTSPDRLEIRIKNEPGIGMSVYMEVLYLMWKTLIDKNIISKDDHGFCISAGGVSPEMSPYLMALGFMSGLCLARGLYLPFPLDNGFWRFLLGEDVKSSFYERFETWTVMLQPMTTSEICDLLCVEPNQVEFQTREELILQHFLPHHLDLETFKTGFDMFTHNISLNGVACPLNDMFGEPKKTQINVETFLSVFDRSTFGERFIEYVRTLSSTQLVTLVHFITGKTRLPFLELGEEKISLAWVKNEGDNLPKAQNCINMLILPVAPPSDMASITKIMSPIFEFPTIFGFL